MCYIQIDFKIIFNFTILYQVFPTNDSLNKNFPYCHPVYNKIRNVQITEMVSVCETWWPTVEEEKFAVNCMAAKVDSFLGSSDR